MNRLRFFSAAALIAFSLSMRGSDTPPVELRDAFASITTNDLMRHVKVLSSDEFQGRAPASRGEELTVKYLVEQFRSIGLEPGNPGGSSYIQKVPLMGITSEFDASLMVQGRSLKFSQPG